MKNRIDAEIQQRQNEEDAWTLENRVQNERSRQFAQTEYLSFLFSALLESPQCFKYRAQNNTFKQQGSHTKGGDAYDLGKVVPEQ